jgi:hypothetical protein
MSSNFDPAKPCKTRCGWPARVVSINVNAKYPIQAMIRENGRPFEVRLDFPADGIYNGDCESDVDLINIVQEQTPPELHKIMTDLKNLNTLIRSMLDGRELDDPDFDMIVKLEAAAWKDISDEIKAHTILLTKVVEAIKLQT